MKDDLFLKKCCKKQVAQQSRKALQESLLHCPNFRMELSWRFTSVLLGPLLRRYAPSDVYTIWKCGEKIRIDGTLRAADGIFDGEEEEEEELEEVNEHHGSLAQ